MAAPDTGLLDQIVTQYHAATISWYSYLFPIASHLFATLAIIELAWSGIWWAVDKSDMSSLWSEFLKKIMFIGFFYAVLLNAHTWIPDIIQSFMQAGESAGQVGTLDPSSVFDQGISIIGNIFQAGSKMGFFSSMLGGAILVDLVAVIIFICFAFIAGLLTITLIESYIVIGAGILMLGFSSSRFTHDFAKGYLTYAITVGAKLFILYLIIGVGKAISQNWGTLIATAALNNPTPFFEVAGSAVVFLMITYAIPSKASSIISGSSHSTLSSLTTAASIAGSAAMMPVKAAFGTANAGMQAIKQASTIAQGSESTMGSIAKGVMGAAANLAVSAAGTATGHYANTGSAMAAKTDNIVKNRQERAESAASNSPASNQPNSTASRPDNPPPPLSSTNTPNTQPVSPDKKE